ncbi:MAG: prepilin peptidase [Actinobacteria bacterium]|nr:prepilin peptidase [Actinomycetota bacterium]
MPLSSFGVRALLAVFLTVMVAAAAADLRRRVIPNRLTYPAMVALAVIVVALALTGHDIDPARGLAGGLAYGGPLFVAAVRSPRAMGMGDAKLAWLIGFVLGSMGWAYLTAAAIATALAGGLLAGALLLAGPRGDGSIPFGPALAIGAFASLALGSGRFG